VSDPIGRPEGMTDSEWDLLGASYMISERGYKARFAERTLEHYLDQLTLYLLAWEQERNNDTTYDEVFNEAWAHIRERYNRQMVRAFDDIGS
jgi:hypothetical protein